LGGGVWEGLGWGREGSDGVGGSFVVWGCKAAQVPGDISLKGKLDQG